MRRLVVKGLKSWFSWGPELLELEKHPQHRHTAATLCSCSPRVPLRSAGPSGELVFHGQRCWQGPIGCDDRHRLLLFSPQMRSHATGA